MKHCGVRLLLNSCSSFLPSLTLLRAIKGSDKHMIPQKMRVFSPTFCIFWFVWFWASWNMQLGFLWHICQTQISAGWIFSLFPLLFTVKLRCCLCWHMQSVTFLGWSQWVHMRHLIKQHTTSDWSWFTYHWPRLWKWMFRYRFRQHSTLSVGN